MSQADLNVANQSGAAFRADLNTQLLALGTLQSGASEPGTTYAYMLWADSANGLLKQRNAANNGWVSLGSLVTTNLGMLPIAGGTMTGALGVTAGTVSAPGVFFSGDTNTGFYSPGADTLALATAGTNRLHITSAGLVGIGTTGPAQTLDVNGTVNFKPATGYNVLFQQSSTALRLNYLNDAGSANVSASYRATAFEWQKGDGSPVVNIDSSGRVGIGTTSPGNPLAISQTVSTTFGNAGTYLGLGGTENTSGQTVLIGLGYKGAATNEYPAVIGYTATSNAGNQNGAIVFGTRSVTTNTAPTERARIDSDGRLLVGTSSARSNFENSTLSAAVQVEGTDYAGSRLALIRNGGGGGINLCATGGASVGSNTAVSSGAGIGEIAFFGSDGSEFVTGALIQAFVDGTPGANDMPGRLVFSTTADGAASPTERMRINNSGAFKASNTGTYSSSTGPYHEFYQTTNTAGLFIRGTNASQTGTILELSGDRTTTNASYSLIDAYNGNISGRFSVRDSGNAVNTNNSYGAISDAKLKENIVDANSQWSDIKALQVRNYNFKEGQTHTQIGLVAQEVELVSPGLVSESPDRDEEGNDLGTVTKSVNYSVLYMKAVKALQEAMERIETLEASNADILTRLSALEAA